MQILNLIIKCEILVVFVLILGIIFLFIKGKIYEQRIKEIHRRKKH
nr:MAG TPA: transmembrane protein [Caudoviricetes sp.]